jgi:SPP1 gp7 family putative phage head morphogenesis protein
MISVRVVQQEINRMVKENVDLLIDAIFHLREDDASLDVTENMFRSLEERFSEYINRGLFEQSVTAVAFDVLAFNNKKYDRGLFGVVGFNNLSFGAQRAMVNSWVSENLSLLKNVNTTQLSQLQTMIMRATRDGIKRAALNTEINKILKTSVSRASMIATDQLYKLDGQLDRAKQTSEGITHYTWRTMGDNRVRAKHQALEGKVRSWDKDTPIPGQEVNCRCIAEPYLEKRFKKE